MPRWETGGVFYAQATMSDSTKPILVEVSVAVSSESELHSLKAGMTIARALFHAGIPYVVAEYNIPDGAKINQAETIPQSEILYRVYSRSTT
jgi:hypothetical protein